jgi:hypothetical protein
MELIYFLIFIAILYIIYINYNNNKETSKSKIITIDVPCKNCNIWNHVDAKTKCSSICKKVDNNNPYTYTGTWKNNTNKLQDAVCKCSKLGKFNKNYLGCPLGQKCFIWNKSDAKINCPKLCKQYSLNKNAEWTGNWSSTSIDSSACECQYYN